MKPHDGTGKDYEEEGAAETNHYALRATDLIPHPTALLDGEKVEVLGVKLSLGRREEWEGSGSFLDLFLFLINLLCLIGNEVHYFFPKSSLFSPW